MSAAARNVVFTAVTALVVSFALPALATEKSAEDQYLDAAQPYVMQQDGPFTREHEHLVFKVRRTGFLGTIGYLTNRASQYKTISYDEARRVLGRGELGANVWVAKVDDRFEHKEQERAEIFYPHQLQEWLLQQRGIKMFASPERFPTLDTDQWKTELNVFSHGAYRSEGRPKPRVAEWVHGGSAPPSGPLQAPLKRMGAQVRAAEAKLGAAETKMYQTRAQGMDALRPDIAPETPTWLAGMHVAANEKGAFEVARAKQEGRVIKVNVLTLSAQQTNGERLHLRDHASPQVTSWIQAGAAAGNTTAPRATSTFAGSSTSAPARLGK